MTFTLFAVFSFILTTSIVAQIIDENVLNTNMFRNSGFERVMHKLMYIAIGVSAHAIVLSI